MSLLRSDGLKRSLIVLLLSGSYNTQTFIKVKFMENSWKTKDNQHKEILQ